jgi:predicted AlkP superfamily pyrophosphatase or phosphodiesterase
MPERSATPLVLVLAVGLTRRLLPHAPRLRALADRGWARSLREVVPAVTCTAQATILTGREPAGHGVVANGWFFRETGEVRFWQQSNALLQAEPVYVTARRDAERDGRRFRCAKLFWWFNQGAAVDLSVTPKPYYAADGNKAFGIDGWPRDRVDALERRLGKFPFPSFWGPNAGLHCTEWIAHAAADVVGDPAGAPELTLVYLPHLDYEPQRRGPSGCDLARLTGELDAACAPLLDAAATAGARVWVASEYGHCDVNTPVYLNRILRGAGLLGVRPGPFGEIFDPFTSRAFAVVDHQLAHVYVHEESDRSRVRELIQSQPGVGRVLMGEERAEVGLDHPRSGDLVVLSTPGAWFAYPFWLDDAVAPDYARTVDIHRKPGYDPCELFFDPNLLWPKGRAARRLLQKKLGFRTRFDVIPLDAGLVRGSHGLPAALEDDRPVLIGDGTPPGVDSAIPLTAVRDLLREALAR